MGSNQATGEPSHRVGLLTKANTKPWIVPIGRKAVANGELCHVGCFSAILVNLEPRGKARHFRRDWPYGAIRTCLTIFASSVTR